jgi:hypothetical protein
MTKPKYSSPEERRAAMSMHAKVQMLAQWERQRQEHGQIMPGYFGRHRRLRTTRGPVKFQACVRCERPAQHWAQLHGTDGADPNDYLAMCQKCHWAYDEVGRRVKEAMTAESRSALAHKAWATKRAKRAIADALGGLLARS